MCNLLHLKKKKMMNFVMIEKISEDGVVWDHCVSKYDNDSFSYNVSFSFSISFLNIVSVDNL